MKSRKLKLLEKILKHFAAKTLRRFKPRVVGVTGSVGKTSTKEAIFAVLSSKFRVRKNEKNFNNEIGLPLTVLGLPGGESGLLLWASVLLRAFLVAYFGRAANYPEVLVLEMGADRPGDIKYLVNFLKPEVGVLTTIGISHLEYFKDKKQIAKEKSVLVKTLNKEGLAVLNFDDEDVRAIAEDVKVKKISYGFSEEADVRASDIFFGYEKAKDIRGGDVSKIKGISFKMIFDGATVPVRLMRSVGRPQIYSVMAGAAVGIHFGMNLFEIAQALKNFQSPAGRLNIIDGIKNSIIIEDSYNAAPQSALAALEVLEKIQARRKLAALGDMLELGEESEAGHREVGRRAAEVVDVLFAVGEKAKFIADEAEKAGLDPVRNNAKKSSKLDEKNSASGRVSNGVDKSHIFCYDSSDEAKIPIQKALSEGDVILVKGSRGMHMENISLEIMRFPNQAKKLLPGQTAE